MNKASILFGIAVLVCQIVFICVFLKNVITNRFGFSWLVEDKIAKRDKHFLSISFILMLLFLIMGSLLPAYE
jgi:hypothetical protein